jgi:hypothetical protein
MKIWLKEPWKRNLSSGKSEKAVNTPQTNRIKILPKHACFIYKILISVNDGSFGVNIAEVIH